MWTKLWTRFLRLWNTVANADLVNSLMGHVGLQKLFWGFVSAVPVAVAGFIASLNPVVTYVLALAAMALGLVVWNQISLRRGKLAKREEFEDKIFPPTVTQTPPPALPGGQDEDDTLEATGVLFPQGLYVGMIIVSGGRLEDEHFLELTIRAYNGTGEAVRIVGIEGAILARDAVLDDDSLPLPSMRATLTPLQPDTEFLVVLEQRVSPAMAREFLFQIDVDSISLDLRRLNIRVELANNPANGRRLPLWDGVLLRRRDDLFTNRMSILTAESGLFTFAGTEATLTVTRGDGTKEVDGDKA